MSELAGLLLGGFGGYLIGKTQAGQTVQIPIKGASLISILCFDLVPKSTVKSYDKTMQGKGRIVGVWVQFYYTTALVDYNVTLNDSNVFNFMSGSAQPISLHETAVLFPCNAPFENGAKLTITVNNRDTDDSHYIRLAIFVEMS